MLSPESSRHVFERGSGGWVARAGQSSADPFQERKGRARTLVNPLVVPGTVLVPFSFIENKS